MKAKVLKQDAGNETAMIFVCTCRQDNYMLSHLSAQIPAFILRLRKYSCEIVLSNFIEYNKK